MTGPTAPTAVSSLAPTPDQSFPTPWRPRPRRVSLARGAVVADNGCVLTLWVDTLCVHGDTPDALAIATAVRRALVEAGIDVIAPSPT